MGLAADKIFHSILIDHTVNDYVKCVDIDLVVGARFVRFDNNPIRFVDCCEDFYIFLKVNSCGNVFDLIYNYEQNLLKAQKLLITWWCFCDLNSKDFTSFRFSLILFVLAE